MSLYNMVFGQNPLSDLLLATLGLRKDDVGRFRDCFISDGQIAVYTRNGGGNRHCWHEGNPKWGNKGCKHHEEQEEAREMREVPTAGGLLTTMEFTGRMVMETRYVCEAPNSAECTCPGCTIQFRLRKHPLYVTDRDDDFDCTYATIYFRFPPDFEPDLKKLDKGETFDPDDRWIRAIEALKRATP